MNQNEPLGIPRGSVRAVLALILVVTFAASHVWAAHHLLAAENVEAGVAVLGALALEVGVVTGFYFGSRPANS